MDSPNFNILCASGIIVQPTFIVYEQFFCHLFIKALSYFQNCNAQNLKMKDFESDIRKFIPCTSVWRVVWNFLYNRKFPGFKLLIGNLLQNCSKTETLIPLKIIYYFFFWKLETCTWIWMKGKFVMMNRTKWIYWTSRKLESILRKPIANSNSGQNSTFCC